jgi:hypothetical protein
LELQSLEFKGGPVSGPRSKSSGHLFLQLQRISGWSLAESSVSRNECQSLFSSTLNLEETELAGCFSLAKGKSFVFCPQKNKGFASPVTSVTAGLALLACLGAEAIKTAADQPEFGGTEKDGDLQATEIGAANSASRDVWQDQATLEYLRHF